MHVLASHIGMAVPDAKQADCRLIIWDLGRSWLILARGIADRTHHLGATAQGTADDIPLPPPLKPWPVDPSALLRGITLTYYGQEGRYLQPNTAGY